MILSKVKARYLKPYKYKCCNQVMGDVAGAKKVDVKNGNTLWQDAIEKVIETSLVPFQLIYHEDKSPFGYK